MTGERKGLRILIVENHPDTVRWLRLFLEDLGHTVGAAGGVKEARAALETGEWEVLISDVGLPDGKGWELLEQGKYPQLRCAIAMSGFGMNADSARSRSAGFQHHLLKPFKTTELEIILEKAASGPPGN